MELRIEGKLIQKLPVESGQSARGEWKKQNFIIETMEQFPRKVCIAAWTNSIPILESYQIGEMLSVGVNIESREFNVKLYTDVRAWRIDRYAAPMGQMPPQGMGYPQQPVAGQMPQGAGYGQPLPQGTAYQQPGQPVYQDPAAYAQQTYVQQPMQPDAPAGPDDLPF